MKLLYCPVCHDMLKLDYGHRACGCGASSGAYRQDGINADANGRALVIGISNPSLRMAVERHVHKYPEDNITIEAWIQAEPHRHITYHRED